MTCHMKSEILNFVMGLLAETDKYIGVANGHFVTTIGEVQIKCGTTMENHSLLRYITWNWYQTCVIDFPHYYVHELGTYLDLHEKFARFFSDNKKNVVTLQLCAQIKHAFWVKTKEMSKSQKHIPKNKNSLELWHQILWHKYTRSLLAG